MHKSESGEFIRLESRGFGKTELVLAKAAAPEGPWASSEMLYQSSIEDDPFVYAGKAHPQFAGEMWVTQVENTFDSAALLDDERLYYPSVFLFPRVCVESTSH